MICCYEMRKGRGSCVEPSSLKNFGSMFDAEAIHAQIPSNIEPNYQIDLNVRRNQPQCSNFALNIRTRQSHCGSCRSKGGRCRGTNGNSSYIFSAEKCTFIIKYSKAWKWCRTFSANFFDLNVRHQTCLRSFCVEHSGQLPPVVLRASPTEAEQQGHCPQNEQRGTNVVNRDLLCSATQCRHQENQYQHGSYTNRQVHIEDPTPRRILCNPATKRRTNDSRET